MKISILTLFPEMFTGPFDHSILKHAQEKGLVTLNLVNIRAYGLGKHKMVDDTPYGGGKGMVLRVDVLADAITDSRVKNAASERVVLLDARGKTFGQSYARAYSKLDHLILVCGHYEGVDERIRAMVDETISIGDFIMTGGEIPAMLIADAVGRLVTGVLSDEATTHESFTAGTLEYPQYTKPREYNGQSVPEVLLSGNHAEIDAWRKSASAAVTAKHRPDLHKET